MNAPNYEQIQSFGHVTSQLKQAAIDEFAEHVHDAMTIDEVVDIAAQVAYKYSMLGEELGAQWYDLCAQLAGVDADDAYLPDVDERGIAERASKAAKPGADVRSVFNEFLSNQIQESIRRTGTANLWRDYERGLTPGKWARVPVGDTCAWCLMLASQGAWYLSKQSALGPDPDHYHKRCNCIAVYYADPDDIDGYSKLRQYKDMYYDADNTRIANARGREKYPEELAHRVDEARKEHKKKYDIEQEKKRKGEPYKDIPPWQAANETAIVMRYQHPGMH
ncbi:MAG: hypothetical protein J6S36_03580 [Eggerthellaceae bacterium]|nr:hypothetical protein [Eggerthellaceae bacterium]